MEPDAKRLLEDEYEFKTLESKYDGFRAPAFEITVGSTKIDSYKIPISALSVDIDAGESAGGCNFTIESQYDYGESQWANELLNTVEVGAKLIIKAGYVTKEEIFYGFVDDYTISYAADAAPRISITGIDAKGYLMNAKDQKYMSETSTATVVKNILGTCISNDFAKSIIVGAITDFNAQLIQDEIDDYKFLCHLAQLYNMSFFVVNGVIVFDCMINRTNPVIALMLGVSLLNFSKKITLQQQVGKVIVYSINPETKKSIHGEVSNTNVEGEGKETGNKVKGFKDIVEKEVNMFAYTPEECKKLAQARFDARASSFVSGEGRCVGIPELIPGRYITLIGLDKASTDNYFITKVTHEYSSDQGYFTTFTVKGARNK